jgi:hypothetical protein
MNWLDPLERLRRALAERPDVVLEGSIGPPATAESLARAARALGAPLPASLFDLYRQVDGAQLTWKLAAEPDVAGSIDVATLDFFAGGPEGRFDATAFEGSLYDADEPAKIARQLRIFHSTKNLEHVVAIRPAPAGPELYSVSFGRPSRLSLTLESFWDWMVALGGLNLWFLGFTMAPSDTLTQALARGALKAFPDGAFWRPDWPHGRPVWLKKPPARAAPTRLSMLALLERGDVAGVADRVAQGEPLVVPADPSDLAWVEKPLIKALEARFVDADGPARARLLEARLQLPADAAERRALLERAAARVRPDLGPEGLLGLARLARRWGPDGAGPLVRALVEIPGAHRDEALWALALQPKDPALVGWAEQALGTPLEAAGEGGLLALLKHAGDVKARVRIPLTVLGLWLEPPAQPALRAALRHALAEAPAGDRTQRQAMLNVWLLELARLPVLDPALAAALEKALPALAKDDDGVTLRAIALGTTGVARPLALRLLRKDPEQLKDGDTLSVLRGFLTGWAAAPELALEAALALFEVDRKTDALKFAKERLAAAPDPQWLHNAALLKGLKKAKGTLDGLGKGLLAAFRAKDFSGAPADLAAQKVK